MLLCLILFVPRHMEERITKIGAIYGSLAIKAVKRPVPSSAADFCHYYQRVSSDTLIRGNLDSFLSGQMTSHYFNLGIESSDDKSWECMFHAIIHHYRSFDVTLAIFYGKLSVASNAPCIALVNHFAFCRAFRCANSLISVFGYPIGGVELSQL